MNQSASGHRPRKRFGQHFLVDQRVLQRIAGSFAPRPGQNLVEIGPGMGALTELLLEQCDHLIAVELDRDLAELLQKRYDSSKLTIHQMDILNCYLPDLPVPHPGEKLRLIGNLPYNISTPLIFHLVAQLDHISSMVFMLQKEVAQRLAASPGNKSYGRLTVMTALEVDTICLFDVPPEAFDPPPKVDSSVICMTPRSLKIDFDRKQINQIVTAAFAQRRKTLRNALRKLVGSEQLLLAGIDPGDRAENISPEQYVALGQVIKQS